MEAEAIQQEREAAEALLAYLNNASQHSLLQPETEWLPLRRRLEQDQFFLCHVDEIMFEEKAPRREALENILGTFRGRDAMNFIYIILGDGQGHVDFYFGVGRDLTADALPSVLNEQDLAGKLLKPSIEGNFRGSQVTELDSENRGAEKAAVLERLRNAKYYGLMTGVPGADIDQAGDDFQGVDRLIDIMGGSSFGFVVLAQPYTEAEMDTLEQELLQTFDMLAPLASLSRQFTDNSTDGWNRSDGFSHGRQSARGIHKTHSQHESESHSQIADDVRHTRNNQVQAGTGSNTSADYGRHDSYSLSRSNSGGSSSNSTAEQTSAGHDGREGYSTSSSEQYNYSDAYSRTDGSSDSSSSGSQTGSSEDNNYSSSYAHNHTRNHTQSGSQSANLTEQLRCDNKAAVLWSKYLDEVLLPRLDRGRGKGLFLACSFLFSDDRPVMYRLANTVMSLYSSPKGNRAALSFTELASDKQGNCLRALQNLQIPCARSEQGDNLGRATLAQKATAARVFGGSWLSAEELGILTGLPQKDVIPIALNKSALDKHTFIAGVTGSGKTTTCQKILRECGLPFLVIEPAKTEYRTLYGQQDEAGKQRFPKLTYFTAGNQKVAPFYLNPFELFPKEPISARADMIKATMEAAFEMEAAIPQILEAGIYRAYESKGWNVNTNEWFVNGQKGKPFAPGSYAFPTLSDFKVAVEQVTREQNFGERLQDEYLGSIRARINGLMVGAKGLMLNTPRSVDFRTLIHRQVVIELEEIRNGAEKSLIMGFIMTNLLQAVRAEYYAYKERGEKFQHITLVEEAHRLFSRFVPGDNPSKRQGVEVFANMLAEVRKYGESLIIVDQIPDKMTPEVLKNTNTKIVHKLFAQDDKEAIGNTMALENDQKAFLSNLRTGHAIVLTQDWPKAVQVKVSRDTCEQPEAADAQVRSTALAYYAQPKNYRLGVLPGLERVAKTVEITPALVNKYLQLMLDRDLASLYQQTVFGKDPAKLVAAEKKLCNALRNTMSKLTPEEFPLLVQYLYWQAYTSESELKEASLVKMLKHWLGETTLDDNEKRDLQEEILNRK